MNWVTRILLLVLAAGSLAMARKAPVTVRFFAEANRMDTNSFASPIQLHFPEREAYIEKIPSINEGMIEAIYPFQAADGSWGAAFKLDHKGRIDLELLSTERRGTSLVVFVGTKTGTHRVIDMIIDKPVRDGIITIPRGLTEMEIGSLTKEFPAWGGKKK
jgi:hypothetical protein